MTKVALDTLVEKKSGNDVYNSMLSTLTKVRDWFHYSNGPHTMAASVMDELNQTVNGFLEQFTAPFVVLPADEGIGFKCRFTDGRKMPEELPDASVLSGGQKVQLAVAFRMAVYCLFASKLGLLSLDEPTAYLDEANIGKFGDLLQVISKIAKNMGVQVLFATHEESLLAYADKVIDLTK
jgi:exonuclease SbcC